MHRGTTPITPEEVMRMQECKCDESDAVSAGRTDMDPPGNQNHLECPPASSAGLLVLRILATFDACGIRYVYLRNYESLPESVGHDVDLLVAPGMRELALAQVRAVADENGWKLLRVAEFSPLAVFLVDVGGTCLVHLDLFDRIERHWLEFGSVEGILARRIFNGTVYHPGIGDEVFLNVCTRLIYHGMVRTKHRVQAEGAVQAGFESPIRSAFMDHLGSKLGFRLADAVIRGEWSEVETAAQCLRRVSALRWGLGSPRSAAIGIFRYLRRTVRRLISPPGPFIVFEGVDGVGKSTIITEIVPLLQEVTGLSDTLQFHWKPCKRSIRICAVAPPSHDPRGQPVRGQIASVLFLGYHWLGFWVGWLRWVYPALTRSQSVVCDRYAVDLWLDPRRFRLALPEWLLKIATRTVPQPGLVIGLVAAPEVVTNRKAELTHAEITVYQERLEEMARNSENICLVDATGPPAMVVAEVRHRILNWLEEKTQHHG